MGEVWGNFQKKQSLSAIGEHWILKYFHLQSSDGSSNETVAYHCKLTVIVSIYWFSIAGVLLCKTGQSFSELLSYEHIILQSRNLMFFW